MPGFANKWKLCYLDHKAITNNLPHPMPKKYRLKKGLVQTISPKQNSLKGIQKLAKHNYCNEASNGLITEQPLSKSNTLSYIVGLKFH